jgi:hypothetical protein
VILQRALGGLVVVRQPAHGDQTGLIADAWLEAEPAVDSSHRVGRHLAAHHHDDGWALWERHPTIDPSQSRPYQFADLPPAEHIPMYRAGIMRTMQLDPWAGLLAGMHGAGLYNDRYGTYTLQEQKFSPSEQTLVDEFLRDMETMRAGLIGRLGHAPVSTPQDWPELWHDYLLLQVWDRLSLEFMLSLADDGRIAPLPLGDGTTGSLRCTRRGTATLVLDPYPFADGVVELPLAVTVVPDQPYPTPEAFLAAVMSAPTTVIEYLARSI